MKVEKQTLRKIAHLARLDLPAEKEDRMIEDISRIITWFEKLQEVDTGNVEPLIHMSEEVNSVREDQVQPSLSHERGLQNAPSKDSDYFRVPKVLE
jgi:aspartyl-tRNA(Asn)/glutamyl-tRNA(Gln) amidotransferase subunit C